MFVIFKEDQHGKLTSVCDKHNKADQAIRFLSEVLRKYVKDNTTAIIKVKRKLEQHKTFDYVELVYTENANNPTLPQKEVTENYYITSFNSVSLVDVM